MCDAQFFFALPFKDRRGQTINSGTDDANWSAMLTNISLLQFIFIDEVEAAGADLLGRVEEQARRCGRRPNNYRLSTHEDTGQGNLVRPFGGMNVVLIGDWWQLHPTGGGSLLCQIH